MGPQLFSMYIFDGYYISCLFSCEILSGKWLQYNHNFIACSLHLYTVLEPFVVSYYTSYSE